MSKNKRTKIIDLPEYKDVQAYLRCISGEGTSKVKGYGVISKSRDRARRVAETMLQQFTARTGSLLKMRS